MAAPPESPVRPGRRRYVARGARRARGHGVAAGHRRSCAGRPRRSSCSSWGRGWGSRCVAAPWPGSYRDLDGADLVVSTTPAGATDQLAATGWRADLPLLDVLYAPWPTALAAAAQAAGAVVAGGTGDAGRTGGRAGHADDRPARSAGRDAGRRRGRAGRPYETSLKRRVARHGTVFNMAPGVKGHPPCRRRESGGSGRSTGAATRSGARCPSL